MIWHCVPTILMHTTHKSHLNKLFKKEVVSSYQRESEIFQDLYLMLKTITDILKTLMLSQHCSVCAETFQKHMRLTLGPPY